MPIRTQFDTSPYRNMAQTNRASIGDIVGAIQGVQGIVGNSRRMEDEELLRQQKQQMIDDDNYLNNAYAQNFSDWDGDDEEDFQKRNLSVMADVTKNRPNLYSKAIGYSTELETAMQDRGTFRAEEEDRVLKNKKTQFETERDVFEHLNEQQDYMGGQFALVAEGKQGFNDAVSKIERRGIKANLPNEQQFNSNPTEFYDYLIKQKNRNDEVNQKLVEREKELGIEKSEKDLESYDRRLQATINQKNRAGTSGAPGGVMDVEAWALARKVAGVRGAKSIYPAIMQRIRAGETIDQIEDKIRYSGQSQEFAGPARSAMQQLFAGKTGKASDAAFDAFDDLLQAGDKDGMSSFLRRSARNTASADEAKQIAGQERTIEFMEGIQADLDAYEAGGGNTNIFSGTMEKIAGAVGAVKDEKLRGYAQRIHTALQKYRRAMSGVAFSVPESKEYKTLFPGIDKTASFNRVAIDALRQTFSEDVQFFYENAMGKNAYNQFIGGAPTPSINVNETDLLNELFPE